MSCSHIKLAYEFVWPISNSFTIMGDGMSSGCRRRYSQLLWYTIYHFPVPNNKNPQDTTKTDTSIQMGKRNLFIVNIRVFI